jgi:hypothetical protein
VLQLVEAALDTAALTLARLFVVAKAAAFNFFAAVPFGESRSDGTLASLRRRRKPTPQEIVASEAGERLLAGHLLRQSADRINVRATNGSVEMTLHYDH